MYRSRFNLTGVAAFFIVLLSMPLGHAAMILMEHWLDGGALDLAAFLLGTVGVAFTIWGTRLSKDPAATLLGFLGGLLVWTGWIEFGYVHFAQKLNVAPVIENGEIVTKPEYLLLMSSVGFWAVIMLFYIFKIRTGCTFFCWIQKKIGVKTDGLSAAGAGDKAMTTFMETNVLLWSCYLLLMFAYDDTILGDRHPVTIAIAVCCLIWSVWLFFRLIKIKTLGRAIRYALPVVIIFWNFVEVMGRIGLFKEIWVEPMKYKTEMIVMAVVMITFAVTGILYKRKNK